MPSSQTTISQKTRPFKVFLCHSSGDKPAVCELYHRLRADNIQPWLDEEDLLPGQDWAEEIPKAVRDADIVLVCLSQESTNKTGYVQKEIKHALIMPLSYQKMINLLFTEGKLANISPYIPDDPMQFCLNIFFMGG